MTAPPDVPVVFEFKIEDKIHHPRIYEKLVMGDQSKYSVRVPLDKVPKQARPCFQDIRPANHDPTMLVTNSRARPEVIVKRDRVDWLVQELTRLDARNVSRDRIFDGKWVIVKVTFRWHDKGPFVPFYRADLETITLLGY